VKRSAGVIGASVTDRPIAIGEALGQPSPTSAAVQLGKLGGAARARKLSPEQRAEIARKGAAKRWNKTGA
jgi:hypothetical protein